jgi:hypothetical protein
MNPSAFLFKIPERLLVAVATGGVRRTGPLLRDAITGRIVAHLQETSSWPNLLGTGGPGGLLLSAGQLASSVTANIQLEQVKSMLGTLQLLTGASLAASVVGVGVSAAGFALVLSRLRNLEHSLAGVRQDVLAGRLAAERVDVQLGTAHRAEMDSLLYRAEEAWVHSDAAKVWKQLEGPLDQAQRYWRGLVGGRYGPPLFLDARFSLEEAAAAYEAALVLAAARVQTLLLIEELAAALYYSREFHRWHEAAVGHLVSLDLAAARARRLAEAEGCSEEDARARLLRAGRHFLEGVQEARLFAADRPALVQTLIDRGIRGREYVEAVRQREDLPLLFLEPAPRPD